MNKGNNNITTSFWFDQWTRQANMRRARRRKVADTLELIANVLCIAGILIMLVGVMWIDATDVCSANVVTAFVGVALTGIGAHLRYTLEGGYLW